MGTPIESLVEKAISHFNPHEARDAHGRWSRTPGSAVDASMTAVFNPDAAEETFTHRVGSHDPVEVVRNNNAGTITARAPKTNARLVLHVDLKTGRTSVHDTSLGRVLNATPGKKLTSYYKEPKGSLLQSLAFAARKHMTAAEAKVRSPGKKGKGQPLGRGEFPYVTPGPGAASAELAALMEKDFAEIGFHPKGIPPPLVEADDPGGGWAGIYHRDVQQLVVRPKQEFGYATLGADQRTTAAHEFGHHLDASLRGGNVAYYESEKRKRRGARNAMKVIGKSQLVRKIRKQAREGVGRRGRGGRPYSEYLAKEREIFARAFAQWVAVRKAQASDASLLPPIRMRGGDATIGNGQWTDHDFADIFHAFDAWFQEEGWLD